MPIKPIHQVQTTITFVTKEFRSGLDRFIRYTIYFVLAVLFISDIILELNVYKDLSSNSKLLFSFVLFDSFLFGKKRKDHLSEATIDIFDDRIIITEKKRFISKKSAKKNIVMILKSDLNSVSYNPITKRMLFSASKIDVTVYDYYSNGQLPDHPSKVFTSDDIEWEIQLYNNDVQKIAEELEAYAEIIVVHSRTGEKLLCQDC